MAHKSVGGRILRMGRLLCVLLLLLSACGAPTAEKWREQYDLGMRYLSEERLEDAIMAFTAAIEIDPKRAEAYVGVAKAYLGAGDEASAAEWLQKGMEQASDTAELAAMLAELGVGAATDGEAPDGGGDASKTGSAATAGNELLRVSGTIFLRYVMPPRIEGSGHYSFADPMIRFSEPVTVAVNGETVTLEEAKISILPDEYQQKINALAEQINFGEPGDYTLAGPVTITGRFREREAREEERELGVVEGSLDCMGSYYFIPETVSEE